MLNINVIHIQGNFSSHLEWDDYRRSYHKCQGLGFNIFFGGNTILPLQMHVLEEGEEWL